MKNILILILSVSLGVTLYFNYKHESELKEDKKKLRILRDNLKQTTQKIDSIIHIDSLKFDSIVKIPPKIKIIKYEKPPYIDRNLDDALDVHSRYKAHSKSIKKN